MARKNDPNSIRQRAFKLIARSTKKKREAVIDKLMTTFDIDLPYAATLYAAKRTIDKASGELVKTYVVRDEKEGKPTDPYVKEVYTYHPGADADLNVSSAISTYTQHLKNKIAKASQL